MANIFTYWDSTTKSLLNMAHDDVERLGGRIKLELADTEDLFTATDDPKGTYKLNATNDGYEAI